MRNDLIVVKMIEIIKKLQNYTKDVDYKSFSDNEMLVEACVFNLSQLGETANKINLEFETANPQIPWRQIYGLRNRIIHDYEGINLKLIWEIIKDDLPELLKELDKL